MNEQKKGGFFSIGLVRGILGYLVGMIIGLGLVTGIRMILGLPATTPWDPQAKTFFFVEGAYVAGALLGTIGFMLSVGVVSDWLKWMRGIETPSHPEDAFEVTPFATQQVQHGYFLLSDKLFILPQPVAPERRFEGESVLC